MRLRPFSLSKDREIFLLSELFREIQPELWTVSLVPSWTPSCTKLLCARSIQLQLWKLICSNTTGANTCTPCSYHLRGVGKHILDCQGTVMVHFQSRACGCKQGCAAQSWEGRRKSTKTHKAALWQSKSVSELWLLDLQSHRQPLACGIQLLLWDKVWGHWGLKRDPARKVSELQENFLTSL